MSNSNFGNAHIELGFGRNAYTARRPRRAGFITALTGAGAVLAVGGTILLQTIFANAIKESCAPTVLYSQVMRADTLALFRDKSGIRAIRDELTCQ